MQVKTHFCSSANSNQPPRPRPPSSSRANPRRADGCILKNTAHMPINTAESEE